MHKYMRRLGDCIVAFDPETWQTFVLPAASTVIADVIMELAPDGQLSIDDLTEALRSELAVDLDSDQVRQVIEILRSGQLLNILQTEEP